MKLLTYLQTNKWLSRRAIVSLINEKKIYINDIVVDSYKIEIDEWDKIKLDWKEFVINNTNKESGQIIMFNKPIDYICSKSDSHNKTIYELLPKEFENYYYIGRLDKNSHGLVLMTNDPKLVDEYEHPRHGITKEYLVTLNKPFREIDMDRCLQGIEDQEEILKCIECKLKIWNTIKMVLNEGKKRHIRRMMSALRYHVEDLVRIREWKFELGDLKEWEWKVVRG